MNSGKMNRVYLISAQQAAADLRVEASRGLTESEAQRRRARIGANALPDHQARSAWLIFLDRFKDRLVLLLVAAAFVSVLMREYADAIIIAIAIWLDATLSFAQVWRTQRTMERLRQNVRQMALVLRDGRLQRIPADQLVPGDIIEFRAGEKIPADGRIVSARGLRVQESALTGESDDVEKSPATLQSKTPLGNQRNMVFMGTTVMSGQGKALVTATGSATEFGKIAQVLKSEASPPSPLRRMLQKTGLRIAWVVMGLVILVILLDMAEGDSFNDAARTGVTLIVSAIPEDLTMILTVALTVGVMRILRKRGAVRELSSAETLGAATVICTDKTGTITEGDMRAEQFLFPNGEKLSKAAPPRHPVHSLAVTVLSLLPDAHRVSENEMKYVGSATERSSLAFAEGLGALQSDLKKKWQIRDSLAFDTRWKYRAGLYEHPTQSTRYLMAMGAPEVLLDKSTYTLNGSLEEVRLTSESRSERQKQVYSLAAEGKRLVAVAWKKHVKASSITHDNLDGLIFAGVLVISDPIRSGVEEAIRETRSAGVDVKLVTGDYEPTAKALARSAGMTVTEDSAINGEELAAMSDRELKEALENAVVIARVNPLDKQRIVRLLQERGHVVAMTGDGVNDAVALKSADIGVAMGSGKDIAKDAADLILLNDSFTTIVAAIREGRVIRDNLRKVIAFLLATNAAEVAIFLASLVMRLPLPLLPAQILWINLVTDGTSDLALSLEPDERNVMKRKPEDPKSALIGKEMIFQIVFSGLVMTAAAMALYWYLRSYLMLDLAYVRTMIFCLLAVSSLLSTWSFRSLSESIVKRGLWQNPWLFLSGGFSLLLQVAAVYIPALQRLLHTVPLAFSDWQMIAALAIVTVVAVDARKFVYGKTAKIKAAAGRLRRTTGATVPGA